MDSFEFLTALNESKLFSDFPGAAPSAGVFHEFNIPTRSKRSYAELSQDRAFYRAEIQFEKLDRQERERLLKLYRLIDESPNANELWRTASVYSFWRRFALNDSERAQMEQLEVADRVALVRKKIESLEQARDLFANGKFEPQFENRSDRPPRNAQAPNARRDDGPARPSGRSSREPSALVNYLRGMLPVELQDEDLSPVYQKCEEMRRNGRPLENVNSLDDKERDELVASLSADAQATIRGRTNDEKCAILNALVALSLAENSENRAYNMERGRFNDPRFANAGPPRAFNVPNARSNNDANLNRLGQAPWNASWRAPEQIPVADLANSLREANPMEREYVVSRPRNQALPALYALYWRFSRAQQWNNQPPSRTPPPTPPRQFGSETRNDAVSTRQDADKR